jgi:diaminohydroxyphosphoribosylaminopyrimidine deaminase/5-amino-6-(5-phosphoribosylamino)uracil reductase
VNLDYLQLAIDEAYKYQLLTYPNPAVGAVVVKEGRVLAIEAHQKAGTSHAEVLALLATFEVLSGKCVAIDKFDAAAVHHFLVTEAGDGFFKDCTIYVTLEPCSHRGKTPSCANLIAQLGLKKVVIGALDPIRSHSGGVQMLRSAGIEVEMLNSKAAKDLIEPFIIWQKRAFVVFKLAQTLNGQIGGGYISSQESLTHVHKIRAVTSKLLIGGNTVRVDRPTLDCRFSEGRAPDIYIYSRSGDFDKSIPLFSVPDRSVAIGEDLEFLQKPGLVLVEGGEGMLNALEERVDWMLHFVAPLLKSGEVSYNGRSGLEFLHIAKNSTDLVLWSRIIG